MTAPDYGEPWQPYDDHGLAQIDDRFDRTVVSDGFNASELRDRAIACVNACAGIPNPEEVVPLLVEAIKSLNASRRCYSAEIDKAFAALGFKSVYDDFNVMAIEPKREGRE